MERTSETIELTASSRGRRLYSFSLPAALSYAGTALLSMLLGAYSPFEGMAPFGAACVMAAWFAGSNPYAACLGNIAGALIAGNYAFAAAAAALGAGIFVISRQSDPPRVTRLLICFAIEAVALLLFGLITRGRPLLSAASACVSVFAGVVIGFAFKAFRAVGGARPLGDSEFLTLSALAGLVTLSMGNASFLGQSPAMIFAGACALFASYRFGIPALAFAVMLGAGRIPASGGELRFMAVLAACTLPAASLRPLGKPGSLIGFGAGALIMRTALRGTSLFTLPEILVICAVFAAVPSKYYMPESVRTGLDRPAVPGRRFDLLQYRVASLAEVLSELSRVYGRDEARLLACVSGTLKRFLNASPSSPAFTAEYGEASSKKPGSDRSGDSSAVCETEGKLLLALSDGMGSGREANAESRAALALLKDLLHVGFGIDDAAECVNSLLASRGSGDMYATLDVMLVDLADGAASFSKHGAPSSFILRGGKLFTLYAEALPIGVIENARGTAGSFRLRSGDSIIMMTDGVADALGDGLQKAVTDNVLGWGDTQMSARSLLEAAEAAGRTDDMSVIVARVEGVF
ncbi:MAG: SpoIIE family protein phosphatase [Clostridia bacterium]|nr:SpoIIE family protein phosphatase [Clostridia bacterium]